MELSYEQSYAIRKILSHSYHNRPFFLGGYAGTGKTTILKCLLDRLGKDKLLFLAPTGKACQVLQSKLGDADVRTIHAALYSAHEVSEEELAKLKARGESGDEEASRLYEFYTRPNSLKVYFSLNPCKELLTRLVVVDESSMVGEREFNNLVDMTTKIVFVGDPAQLPPVESASILPDQFDAFLQTVHRQASESPIIRLSMSIRNNDPVNWEDWEKEGIIVERNYSYARFAGYNQIIAPMRVTKDAVNKAFRKQRGAKGYLPVVRDKIIVRQNVKGEGGNYLVNGDIGIVTEVDEALLTARFAYPVNPIRDILMNDEDVAKVYKTVSTLNTPKYAHPTRFDYAYAITVHSSQGSEWPRVLFCDDGMWKGNREGRKRLLYTAVTRAKDELGIFIAR